MWLLIRAAGQGACQHVAMVPGRIGLSVPIPYSTAVTSHKLTPCLAWRKVCSQSNLTLGRNFVKDYRMSHSQPISKGPINGLQRQVSWRYLCSQGEQALPRYFIKDKMTGGSQLIYYNRLLNFFHQGVFKWSLLPFFTLSVYLMTVGIFGNDVDATASFAELGFKRPHLVKWECYGFILFLIGIVAVSHRGFIRIYYTPATGTYTGVRGMWNTGLTRFEFMQYQVISRKHLTSAEKLLRGNIDVKGDPYNASPRWFTSDKYYKQFHNIKA